MSTEAAATKRGRPAWMNDPEKVRQAAIKRAATRARTRGGNAPAPPAEPAKRAARGRKRDAGDALPANDPVAKLIADLTPELAAASAAVERLEHELAVAVGKRDALWCSIEELKKVPAP